MEVSSPTPPKRKLASSTDGVDVDIDASNSNLPENGANALADTGNPDATQLASTTTGKKRRREGEVAEGNKESASSLADNDVVAHVAGTSSNDGSNTTGAIHRSEPELSTEYIPASKKRRLHNEQSEVLCGADPPSMGIDIETSDDGPTRVANPGSITSNPQPMGHNGSLPEHRPPSKKARLEDSSIDSVADNTAAPESGSVLRDDSTTGIVESSKKTPGLLKLPLELLSEILIHTGSPQYVLAVARTCKSLCHTLLSRDAQFIWREARKGPGCVFEHKPHPDFSKKLFKLPDPPAQFFGEPAYAAFVFDSGKCDVCSEETSVLYSSFALRARLCNNRKCLRPSNVIALTPYAMANMSSMSLKLREILPDNELESFTTPKFVHHIYFCMYYSLPVSISQPGVTHLCIGPHDGISYCNTEAYNAAKTEHLLKHNDPAYQVKFEKLKLRNNQWMEFCVELAMWKFARQAQYYKNKKANLKLGKQIASKYGWEFSYAFCATSYSVYQSRKNKLIESMDELDVKFMKEKIEAELLVHGEKVERRTVEMTLMSNRKDVEVLYLRLRSKRDHPYLPSLSTFRQLPVVAMLQSAEPGTSSSVAETLQSNAMMKNLLSSQLKKWTEKAMQDLGVKLGFPKNWKNASKNILHPVQRVTARFSCAKCQRVDAKYRDDGCLDFAGVCTHECGVGNAKKGRVRKGKKNIWESANFVKDEKAINALRKCLAGLGYAEDRDGGNYMLKTGIAAVCTSCDPPMVVDTRNVIGHSHRHENMEVKFESLMKIESYLGNYPYEYGVCQKLLGPSGVSQAAKMEIEKRNFGCRHCLRAQQVKKAELAASARGDSIPLEGSANTEAAAENSSAQDIATVVDDPDAKAQIELATVVSRMHDSGIEGPLEKPPVLFTFNGLRSHLKTKHGEENIRDEDIFCHREVLP